MLPNWFELTTICKRCLIEVLPLLQLRTQFKAQLGLLWIAILENLCTFYASESPTWSFLHDLKVYIYIHSIPETQSIYFASLISYE